MARTKRDVMRNLYRRLGADHDKGRRGVRSGRTAGEVTRASNVRHMEPEGWMR